MTAPVRSGPKYMAGAVLCALVNNIILIAGAHAGLADEAGVAIAWLVGGTIGYAYHSYVTFDRRLEVRSYGQFMIGTALGVPLTWLSLVFFRSVLRWPMELASPATTIALFVYNYMNAQFAIAWRARRAPPLH
jgi:putative flippase GtrA